VKTAAEEDLLGGFFDAGGAEGEEQLECHAAGGGEVEADGAAECGEVEGVGAGVGGAGWVFDDGIGAEVAGTPEAVGVVACAAFEAVVADAAGEGVVAVVAIEGDADLVIVI
jgi:hypothetical protein